MAKDIYDKLKIVSEILKNYKWFILLFITGISGTNMGQYFFNQSKINKHLEITPVSIINKTVVKEVNYKKIQLMINAAIKKSEEKHEGDH